MNSPESVFEETVRLHGLTQVLLEAGFLEYMTADQLDELIDSISWSDLDMMVSQDEWVADLMETLKWLFGQFEEIDHQAMWFLCEGVRKYAQRLEEALEEDDDGESWKHGR